jgi:hypothetical protein
VSTLVHANKTEKTSREGVLIPFNPIAWGEQGEPVYKKPGGMPVAERKPMVCVEDSCTPSVGSHGVYVCL